MMRSSIFGASTLSNVLLQHLSLQSLFWTKTWRAFQASDPSTKKLMMYLSLSLGLACSTKSPLKKLIMLLSLALAFRMRRRSKKLGILKI